MAKVEVTVVNKPYQRHAVGAIFEIGERDAKVLQALKRVSINKVAARGDYQTRQMVAQPPVAPAVPQYIIKVEGQDLVLDELDQEVLHELAEKLQVRVHHMLGAPKLRIALTEAMEERAKEQATLQGSAE